jgi:membrane associated rhomboid family serine protease
VSVQTSAAAVRRKYDVPIATYALIALNLAVYVAIAVVSDEDRAQLYRQYGLVAGAPHFLELFFNMFTSSFLHSDPLHLATNMFFLWLFGRTLERAIGVVRYLLLYVGSGIFAAITHLAIVYAFMPDALAQPSLGASGAIAGILGLYAIRFPRVKFELFGLEIPATLVLLAWLVLQILLGIMSLYVPNPRLQTVDYWAHMGGFIFGIIVAHFTKMARAGRKEYLLFDAEDSFKRGTLLDVARKYEALLRYDPDDAFTNAELGRTWALLDDAEQALPHYEAAINLYLDDEKGEDAAARCQEMTHLLPHSTLEPKTLYRLACSLEESGKASKAIGILGKICQIEPTALECEMALLKMGQIQFHHMGHAQQAIATLERFLKSYPESEWRHFAEQTLADARQHPA